MKCDINMIRDLAGEKKVYDPIGKSLNDWNLIVRGESIT